MTMISLKYGIPVPTMYDISDSVGVHVSTKGVSVLEDKIPFFSTVEKQLG